MFNFSTNNTPPTPDELAWAADINTNKFGIDHELATHISEQLPGSITIIRKNDTPVGYTTLLPSTSYQMREFLDGRINEETLIEDILMQQNDWRTSNSIYAHDAYVNPVDRQQQLALQASMQTLIDAQPPTHASIFTRATSHAARTGLKKLSALSGHQLYLADTYQY